MTLQLRSSLLSRWFASVIILGSFLVLSLAAFSAKVSAGNLIKASSEHVLTIHDSGTTVGIYTDANNLDEALKKAGIILDKNDVVEPSLDEPLVAANYEVNIYRARAVTIIDGQIRMKVMTAYQTPKQIARSAKIELYDEDAANIAQTTTATLDGSLETMTIDRAKAVEAIIYGKQLTLRSHAETVGEMLDEKNIKIADEDHLSVSLDDELQDGMKIELWRNGIQTITKDEEITMPVEKIYDADQPTSYRKVKDEGKPGKRSVTYKVTMKNGKEVSREEISSIVVERPTKQIEIIGTKNNYSGSLNEWLLALRTCETHGNYQSATGNGYYGAYQFLPSTWNNIAKRSGRNDLVGVLPSQASPADQDAMVIANTNATAGLSTQHPGCYTKLGLSNKPPAN